MTTRKFELTDETHPSVPQLHRIRALVDIPRAGVRAGELGGWVESESCLAHSGDAWVSGNAQVFGNARVSGNAWVSGDAEVSGNARVFRNAQVFGNARVSGNAWVSDLDSTLTAGPLSSQGHYGTLTRQPEGQHQIAIGCWSGTTDDLRKLATSANWPSSADDTTRAKYAPRLLAFAALCDAQIALWS